MSTPVGVERGSRRIFVFAVDWPGWCRSGRDEEEALGTLSAYAVRYKPVARSAKITFPADAGEDFTVVERVKGNATTDFGAPAATIKSDRRPSDDEEAARIAALVRASWTEFNRVVAGAPAELRKGPRGGGRDRDAIVEHVADAEIAYGRKLGVRRGRDLAAVRAALVELFAAQSNGRPLVQGGWPVRYGARRVAWHALDHAWEIEDKS